MRTWIRGWKVVSQVEEVDGIPTPALKVQESDVGPFRDGRNGLIPIGVAGRSNVLAGPTELGHDGSTLDGFMQYLGYINPVPGFPEMSYADVLIAEKNFELGMIDRKQLAGIRVGKCRFSQVMTPKGFSTAQDKDCVKCFALHCATS